MAVQRILVADDDEAICDTIEDALHLAGYLTMRARDGQMALDRVRNDRPDLVILDVNMPKMDGLTLIKSLRGLPQYRATPILMLTTESSDAMKAAGKAAGATGWLVKPFDPQKLLEVVKKVIG